ncbi:MAG: type II toxin-antitoxin system VapC family toxin [Roseiarcus sp.]
MIVVDSSALIAILSHESDAALFAAAIQKADRLLVSAVNVHETGIVLRARATASPPPIACGAFFKSRTISRSFPSTRPRRAKLAADSLRSSNPHRSHERRRSAGVSSPLLSSPHDDCVPSAFASMAAVVDRFERVGKSHSGRNKPRP